MKRLTSFNSFILMIFVCCACSKNSAKKVYSSDFTDSALISVSINGAVHTTQASNLQTEEVVDNIFAQMEDRIGTFTLIDSISIPFKKNLIFHINLVHKLIDEDQCKCIFYVFRENNLKEVVLTDQNNEIFGCQFNNPNSIFAIMHSDNGKLIVTADHDKYVIDFKDNGAYLKSICSYQKKIPENEDSEIIVNELCVDNQGFGDMRLKDITWDILKDLEWSFSSNE